MLPSPYESHDPRQGLPAFILPVFISMIAGSWLIASVLVDLIINRESRLARCHSCQLLRAAHRVGNVLVVELIEMRFVIEQVHLRGATRHE